MAPLTAPGPSDCRVQAQGLEDRRERERRGEEQQRVGAEGYAEPNRCHGEGGERRAHHPAPLLGALYQGVGGPQPLLAHDGRDGRERGRVVERVEHAQEAPDEVQVPDPRGVEQNERRYDDEEGKPPDAREYHHGSGREAIGQGAPYGHQDRPRNRRHGQHGPSCSKPGPATRTTRSVSATKKAWSASSERPSPKKSRLKAPSSSGRQSRALRTLPSTSYLFPRPCSRVSVARRGVSRGASSPSCTPSQAAKSSVSTDLKIQATGTSARRVPSSLPRSMSPQMGASIFSSAVWYSGSSSSCASARRKWYRSRWHPASQQPLQRLRDRTLPDAALLDGRLALPSARPWLSTGSKPPGSGSSGAAWSSPPRRQRRSPASTPPGRR